MRKLPTQTELPTLNRRAAIAAGAGALAGLAGTAGTATTRASQRPAGERACIFIWLNGGPSQLETFDPKPLAKADVRGPFGAIRTQVPGILMSELVPRLARRIDKLTLLRSLSHGNADHGSTAMLTGMDSSRVAIGAVVTKLLGTSGLMPPYVHIGSSTGDGSQFPSNIDQVGAAELGAAYAPLRVRAPSAGSVDQVKLGTFTLREGLTRDHLAARVELLDRLREQHETSPAAFERMLDQQRRAAELLGSSRVRETFDLARESDASRARYGANFFGQSCLLARRLVEAGTRFVQIKWYDVVAFDAWDTHGADLPGMRRMEQQLCPRLDQGLAALLDDLHERGLLGSTLVVVAGEFGRTPKINKNGDRDHWPHCFSVMLAGAGLPGGAVIGASDDKGAYPERTPIKPTDFAATLYEILGIPVATDLRVRPFIQDGIPVSELFA
jgi:uncharacterized protein (DUF1501 family)